MDTHIHPGTQSSQEDNGLPLKEIILTLKDWIFFLLSKKFYILLFLFLGGIAGALYSILSEKKYVAEANFVFEDPNNTNAGALALLGMDQTGDAGLFQGDNLIWLYTSNHMIQRTLLAKVDSNGQAKVLINWFIEMDKEIFKIANKLSHSSGIVLFKPEVSPDSLSTSQNYILSAAIRIIKKRYLSVSMVDKTSGVINVKLVAKNELFAKNFIDHIVSSVNSYYIQTKTRKAAEQVSILESKVDEFNKNINTSMYQAARSSDAVPYANPSLQTLKVTPQRKDVDIQINSAIYTQMVQQLEAAKISLAKETPLIQVVDAPLLPLSIQKPSLVKFVLIGAFGAFFLILLGLILKESVRRALAK